MADSSSQVIAPFRPDRAHPRHGELACDPFRCSHTPKTRAIAADRSNQECDRARCGCNANAMHREYLRIGSFRREAESCLSQRRTNRATPT